MTTDMSIIGLVMGASIPVQIVLFLLLAASFASWSIIFTKRRLISRTKKASDDLAKAAKNARVCWHVMDYERD